MKHQWFGLRKLLRKKRAVVLMYHRVADLETDPWELAVSPVNFEAQIDYLTRKYKILKAEELAMQLKAGKLTADSICITFDDGYKDNVEAAMPILEKYNCPATFFIATKYLIDQQPYWWDELERIILHSLKLAPTLDVCINGEQLHFQLEDDGWLTDTQKQHHQKWTWEQVPPTQRCAAYYAIWEKLKPLPFSDIQATLTQLRLLIEKEALNDTAHFPMTLSQLQELGKNPLFTIGLHTHTHPALKYHDRKAQLEELSTNNQQLETLLNRKIDTLSYPYGIFDDNTLSIVNGLSLSVAFTTNPRLVTALSHPYKLGRIPVQDQEESTFAKEIAKYFY